ncbi:MAG: DNA internalization-related competence protein ComEC/Rec2, partial [Gammaproteobacteria bacterium]|nr:DNA internalization-related competence protein ComEC/Rec2 [Gammaproteobacteria bacterium]
ANLLASPVVSMLVVPLVLVAVAGLCLQVPGAATGLQAAEQCLQWLFRGLEWLSGVGPVWWQQGGLDGFALILAVTGVFILCLPRGVPARWLGVLWLLPLSLPGYARPDAGQVWVSLLDVGQGMSAVIQTRQYVLVYDTGARFSDHFDAGTSVLLPYLRDRGIRKIDHLLISHGDNDHIGGARALLEQLPVKSIVSSVPEAFAVGRARHCYAGETWYRDRVRFEILHPGVDDSFTGNNASCVLRVSIGRQSLLLTGDIERAAEYRLLHRYGNDLESTVMTVPHHGSKTSSSGDFIEAVNPGLALVTAGYRNRYGFPKQAIMARYRERAIPVMETARHGAITIRLTGERFHAHSHRQGQRRFWYSRHN